MPYHIPQWPCAFVYAGGRKQPADRAWRSLHEGKGEPEEAQSSAPIPSSVWCGGLATPTAKGEKAGRDRRCFTGGTAFKDGFIHLCQKSLQECEDTRAERCCDWGKRRVNYLVVWTLGGEEMHFGSITAVVILGGVDRTQKHKDKILKRMLDCQFVGAQKLFCILLLMYTHGVGFTIISLLVYICCRHRVCGLSINESCMRPVSKSMSW